MHTFAKLTINTAEGGTHEEGFRAALTTIVNNYARDQKLVRDKWTSGLSGEDVREGLAAIIHVKLTEPGQFEGQTKTKLGNTERQVVRAEGGQRPPARLVRPQPGRGQGHHHQGQPGGPGPIAARQARDLTRRKGLLESSPHCPASWPTASPGTRSAVRDLRGRGRLGRIGSAARAATLSSRPSCLIRWGKILNVEKARIDRVLKNNEVQALITALGTGIHDDFDITKLRYHKIIPMADADVDGQHITTLLLTLLFRFMKPLIEAGHASTWPSRRSIRSSGRAAGPQVPSTPTRTGSGTRSSRLVSPRGAGTHGPAMAGTAVQGPG